MKRIIITIFLIQTFICVAALHYFSGNSSIMINNTTKDEGKYITTQRYMQTGNEIGVVMFAYRKENLAAQHRRLKKSEWSAHFTFPKSFPENRDASKIYHCGVSIDTHDNPKMSGFKATYIYMKIWLLELLLLVVGILIWTDKSLLPLVKYIRRSIKKREIILE